MFRSTQNIDFNKRFQSHNVASSLPASCGFSISFPTKSECRQEWLNRPAACRSKRRPVFFACANPNSFVRPESILSPRPCSTREHGSAGPSQGRREAPPVGLVLDWPSTVLCVAAGRDEMPFQSLRFQSASKMKRCGALCAGSPSGPIALSPRCSLTAPGTATRMGRDRWQPGSGARASIIESVVCMLPRGRARPRHLQPRGARPVHQDSDDDHSREHRCSVSSLQRIARRAGNVQSVLTFTGDELEALTPPRQRCGRSAHRYARRLHPARVSDGRRERRWSR